MMPHFIARVIPLVHIIIAYQLHIRHSFKCRGGSWIGNEFYLYL